MTLLLAGCEPKKATQKKSINTNISTLPYQFNKPDATFKLPNKLKEISGLGIDSNGEFLYTVQDEEGTLFKIQASDGTIAAAFEFTKEGDYEGVEYAKGRYFAVNSKGTLFEIINPGIDSQEVHKHKLSFYKQSDIEGLGYDSQSNCLLFSAKGEVGKGKVFKEQKSIYQFSLDSMKIDETPKYTISLVAIKAFLKNHDDIAEKKELEKLFKSESEFKFGPSGIATHPITRDIYVTSSIGKLLVILNPTGAIKHIIKLKKKIHQQPEGICFDQNGTLYISNEGKTGKGKIYKFYLKK